MDAAKDKWERMAPWTQPQSLIQYNEANYFYDFVRPVLYGDEKGTFQVHYQHLKAKGAKYVITLESGASFKLELDSIGLSFYNSGVGVLSFHCYNRNHKEPGEILQINQFGRRLYPPFLATDPEKVGTQEFFRDHDWQKGLKGVKKAELAQAIDLKIPGFTYQTENFNDWAVGAPNLEQTPGLLRQLLPPALQSSLAISPVLDDRMFVVCWYGNDDYANSIDTRSFSTPSDKRDWWYKFVFVDGGGKTCQNEDMTLKLLREHSNLRWGDYGTLYGVSRYSFVCLTGSLDTLKAYNVAYIPTHIQTNYFKLAELALLQRGCVLRFSDEVTAISDLPKNNRALGAHVSSLYKQYIRFVNKIYFREVTAQEQGIELYDLLQKHMRIESQVKDLEKEVGELHQYVMLLEENRRNEKLDILTYIGAFFVVPSFLMGYLGINAFETHTQPNYFQILICLASSLLIGILMLIGLQKKGAVRWLLLVTALIAVTLFMLFIPDWIFD
ncbi:MAG: hypothetical protein KDC61_02175 [Saprospiraceae bacterium]|nr:hypothetical protein [Saprospiraceae bacterium]